MKKSLIALAALTAFAGAASAQSSVTLFGIVDLSVNNVKNGSASQTLVSSDALNSNRLGFRGTEDLGGGLRAGFHIEGAMSPDTGGTGQTWQRRSTVSLLGSFGEVRLGRDYTPTFWNHTSFDPFGTNGLGSQLNVMLRQGESSLFGAGATTTVRANNTVGYFLPALGGIYGQVQLAAGEGAVGNKYMGGRIGYAAGPVNVAVAYGKTEIDSNRDQIGLNIAGSYNLGFMTLMGQWHSYETDLTTTLQRKQTNWLVGTTVPFGASTLKFSYNKVNSDGSDRDATQFSFGYQYDLSKRTALYATYSSLDNGGDATTGARYTVGQGATLTAGGTKSTGYNVGVRHSF